MLPNLSPADATTYSCLVTVSSANPGDLIRQISNQSSIVKGMSFLFYEFSRILNVLICKVQAPAIQLSPGGSRVVYYSGEDLNVTCISTVVGAVFTWRAVNITTQQPLIIPNTTVSSGSNANVLVFRPIKVTNHVLVDLTCGIAFPENVSIIGSAFSTLVNINGENYFFCYVDNNFYFQFQH